MLNESADVFSPPRACTVPSSPTKASYLGEFPGQERLIPLCPLSKGSGIFNTKVLPFGDGGKP